MEFTIAEEVKDKSGPELFHELLRQLPLVGLEDYCKNGVWQNDLMRLDVQIIAAARMEAGAPDLPPLSSVRMPELPAAPRPLQPMLGSWSTVQRPPSSSWLVRPGPGLGPLGPLPGALWPMGTVPGAMVSSFGGLQRTADASAGLRQVSLFVAKWGLDPARTSGLLAKLSPVRRNFVMTTFKDVPGVAAAATAIRPPGSAAQPSSTARLEEYIKTCEAGGAWAAAERAAAEENAANAANVAGGTVMPIAAGPFTVAPPVGFPGAIAPGAAAKAVPVTVAPPVGSPGFNALATAAGAKRPLDGSDATSPPLLRPKVAAPFTVPAEMTTVGKAAAMAAVPKTASVNTVPPPTRENW